MKNNKSYNWWTYLAIVLCVPAFLINIEKVPFIADEAIRSLVALEMMLSGNYIVPRINGSFYFSKPPLYNWILIVFFRIFNTLNEWVARFPTVIFTFSFGYLVYWFNKDKFNYRKHAVLLAFMFLTCGRMIFYDTYLGLIDIFFSMVTYTMIMLSYRLAEKNQYGRMYLMMYVLAVIGFMLKGLPSLHFLFFGMLIIHYINDSWKKLFTIKHLVSIALSGLILFVYFYSYNQYIEAVKTVGSLFDQASRRTILRYGVIDVIKHLFTYPFENLYHFLPWSVMGVLALRKDIITKIKSNKYIWFCSLSFIANFSIYWVSPEVYARYILMLIPLIFTIWIYLYDEEVVSGKDSKVMILLSSAFKILMIVLPALLFFSIFHSKIEMIAFWQIKIISLIVAMAFLSHRYFSYQPHRPMILVVTILLVRIGFDLFVLPVRASTGNDVLYKNDAIRIAKTYGHDIAIYDKTRLNIITSFYHTNETKTILKRTSDINAHRYFIIDSCYMDIFPQVDTLIDSEYLGTRWIIEPNKLND